MKKIYIKKNTQTASTFMKMAKEQKKKNEIDRIVTALLALLEAKMFLCK